MLCLTATVTGCGGEDDSTAKEEEPKIGVASELPRIFIARMAKLLETTDKPKDCAQLEEINARSFTRFTCPPAKSLRKSMASFEIVGAQDYGTGAVVDYKSGELKEGGAILMFVTPDRNWAVSRFGLITKPSTKTDDQDSREGFGKAVEGYLTAVRERDCDAYIEAIFDDGKKRKEICKDVFPSTDDLAKRLKQDRSASPKYEGGNGTYGFYTIETSKPEPANSTITVIKAGVGAAEEYLVLDVGPSPTAADQRKAAQQLKKQLKQKRQGGTGPSDDAKPSEPAVKQ